MQLIPRTRDEVLATLEILSPEVRARISPRWLALLQASAPQDPWVHGFHIVNGAGETTGLASFKGPPVEGVVEIAYAVQPAHQGKGFATAAARALAGFAFASGAVRCVCAHTLPDAIASQRVLLKSGFEKTAELLDPQDGPVWRFEKHSTPEIV
jgi:ribosomal-protein-alanine N-acetyltransferase